MITRKMLETLAAKYGGRTAAVLSMAEQVAGIKLAAEAANLDFNDICDIADLAPVRAKARKVRPAPLLDRMKFCEADAFAG